jgi:hypothetical protein
VTVKFSGALLAPGRPPVAQAAKNTSRNTHKNLFIVIYLLCFFGKADSFFYTPGGKCKKYALGELSSESR